MQCHLQDYSIPDRDTMEYAGLICDVDSREGGMFHTGGGVCFMQESCQ